MNVKDEIRRAIKNGIHLGDLTAEEEKKYIYELFSYLINKKNFCTFKDDNRTIVASSLDEDLAEIYIHAGTLRISPLASVGYFQVFMDVLGFLANKHKEEMKLLEVKEQKKEIGEDDSTEDDGEWWL